MSGEKADEEGRTASVGSSNGWAKKHKLTPIYVQRLSRAEVVETDDGLVAIMSCGEHKFEVPVLAASRKGFRGDLVGRRLVIGYADEE